MNTFSFELLPPQEQEQEQEQEHSQVDVVMPLYRFAGLATPKLTTTTALNNRMTTSEGPSYSAIAVMDKEDDLRCVPVPAGQPHEQLLFLGRSESSASTAAATDAPSAHSSPLSSHEVHHGLKSDRSMENECAVYADPSRKLGGDPILILKERCRASSRTRPPKVGPVARRGTAAGGVPLVVSPPPSSFLSRQFLVSVTESIDCDVEPQGERKSAEVEADDEGGRSFSSFSRFFIGSSCEESLCAMAVGAGDQTQPPSAVAAATAAVVSFPFSLSGGSAGDGNGHRTHNSRLSATMFSTNPLTLQSLSSTRRNAGATETKLPWQHPPGTKKVPLPSFYQSVSHLLLHMTQRSSSSTRNSRHAFSSADEFALAQFFSAFFVEEEWFTKESLVHSLCLVNRLTKTFPKWWRREGSSHGDRDGTEAEEAEGKEEEEEEEDAFPVPLMPSECDPEDADEPAAAGPDGFRSAEEKERDSRGCRSGDSPRSNRTAGTARGTHDGEAAQGLFTRATLPRALLALLLLSSKFVDDITYNTESICQVMARLRERQRGEREQMSGATRDVSKESKAVKGDGLGDSPRRPTVEGNENTSACPRGLAQHLLAKQRGRAPDMASSVSSCASLCSLGATSTTSSAVSSCQHSDASGRGPAPVVYPVLKPERLGQCEQRMFKLLNHSVLVQLHEFNSCRMAMSAMESQL